MILKVLLFFFVLVAPTFSISLEDAIQYALKNNRDIIIQEAELELRFGEIKESRSIYDPNLTIELNYIDSTTPSTSAFAKDNVINEDLTSASLEFEGYLPTGTHYSLFDVEINKTKTDLGTSAISPRWETSLEFTLRQNLFRDFGTNINNSKIIIAKRNNEISKIELERIIASTILDVETKYWNVVYAGKNLELAYFSLRLAEDLVEKNRIEIEIGTLPKIALLQAQSEVAFRKVNLIKAENAYQASSDLLKLSLSLPLSQKIIVDDYVEKKILKQFDESELEYIAINNRPEIRQESMQLENSKQLVKYYSNQLLPDFDIEASLAYAGLGGSKNSDYSTTILGVPRIASKYDEGFSDSMDTLKSLENKSWSIGAKLTIPLNNNAAEGRYEIAIAQRNQRISLLNKLLDSINLDTRNSYRELMSSIKNVESSKLYLSLKDEVLKIEEERFKIGMAKTRDVLEAQRDMIYAQAEYNKALSNYNISIASLEYSLGILIKERKIILDN